MSGNFHLYCASHRPHIHSDPLGDLEAVREYASHTRDVVDIVESPIFHSVRFTDAAYSFLSEHPYCRIGIADECGASYPLIEDGENDD